VPRVATDAAAKIGRNIAELRQAVSLTQDQVAAATGIDSSNIRAYENGRAMPNIQSLLRIASALGAEPSDLLENVTLEMFGHRSHDGRRRAG